MSDAAACPLCDGEATKCATLTVDATRIKLYCKRRQDAVAVSMVKFNRLACAIDKAPPFERLVHHVRMELNDGQQIT